MPRSRKRKTKKENWFGIGFLVGMLFGGPIYYVALGYYDPYPIVRFACQIAALGSLISGWCLTFYDAYNKGQLIDPLIKGFITGFGCIATAISWYLHGIAFIFFS